MGVKSQFYRYFRGKKILIGFLGTLFHLYPLTRYDTSWNMEFHIDLFFRNAIKMVVVTGYGIDSIYKNWNTDPFRICNLASLLAVRQGSKCPFIEKEKHKNAPRTVHVKILWYIQGSSVKSLTEGKSSDVFVISTLSKYIVNTNT